MSDNMSDPNRSSNKPVDESSKSKMPKMPKLDANMKNNLLRGVYMILFLVIGYIAAIVILLITIFQFVYTIIFKAPNVQVRDFSKNMNTYFYDLIKFLTYHSEVKPFPFTPWPKD